MPITQWVNNLVENLVFILERLTWVSIIDLALVTLIFFGIMLLFRNTQAMMLLRGVLLLFVLVTLFATFEILPAFSSLMKATLPALIIAIPVIFAPEIRRTLERLGRASALRPSDKNSSSSQDTIAAVVSAATRLASRKHGALIVLQHLDSLRDYVATGVLLDATVTPEMLLQIFYPNTPLHDGAVIIIGSRIVAAACVMPLSASGVLTSSPDRQMGLRHRAALGISEVSDAVAVVVSEESGAISVVHSGRMIRRLDAERLENILRAFYRPVQGPGFLGRLLSRPSPQNPKQSGDD
jgi:diadenylate cyclase